MTSFARIRLHHVYQDANFFVDLMAKEGGFLNVGYLNNVSFFIFDSPPLFVSQMLSFDA